MHRIDGAGATADNRFTEGNPATGTSATVVTDDWLNAVQEEIAGAIEAAGLELDRQSNSQLSLLTAPAATQAEAEAGTDNAKRMTALRVFQAIRSATATATEALRGVLRIGTQAEVNAGTLDDVAVTPKKLHHGMLFSFAANGYFFLPSCLTGFGVQWGVTSGATSFPIAFPVAAYGVVTQEQGSPAGTTDNGTSGLSAAGFTLTNSNNSAYYLAWGK